jgi:CDP-glucose 4,6-dehydratase
MASVEVDFWKGKKVFLTGHTGFKGSWLALWLHRMGAEVTGFALAPNTNPSLYEALRIADVINSQIGDVTDAQALTKAMSACRPDIVIHMAAQALVRYSYENPVETYNTNVMGTVHLFEAIRKVNTAKVIVNVTSDKCYENKETQIDYSEDAPMGGYDPYSSSKGCAELVTAAYSRSFFKKNNIGLASARAGNVIGGGDWSTDRLIPDIVRAIRGQQKVKIRNPSATRPWQHVLEPLSGYLILAHALYNDRMNFAEGFNFGPEKSDVKPVQLLVEKFLEQWQNKKDYELEANTGVLHEAKYLSLDISKAKRRLEWKPTWSLERTLKETASWYLSYYRSPETIRAFTESQIESFMEEARSL